MYILRIDSGRGYTSDAGRLERLPAVLLAAGRGARLAPLTLDRPKAMVEVAAKSLLERAVGRLRGVGVETIVAVAGHQADTMRGMGADILFNPEFARYENIYSLWLAHDIVAGGCFVVNSDVLFEDEVARRLVEPGRSAVLVDDVQRVDAESMKATQKDGVLAGLSKAAPARSAKGEYIGLARIAPSDGPRLAEILDDFVARKRLDVYYEEALVQLAAEVPIELRSVGGLAWIEIDDHADLRRAEEVAVLVDAEVGSPQT